MVRIILEGATTSSALVKTCKEGRRKLNADYKKADALNSKVASLPRSLKPKHAGIGVILGFRVSGCCEESPKQASR